MEIVSLRDISCQAWEQFVEASDECWLFHRPEIHDLSDSAFQGFGIISSGKLIGLCILYVRQVLGTKILTYHMGPAGLALQHEFQNKTTYAFLRNYLIALAKQYRCSAIYLTLPASAPANLEKSFEQSHLAQLGFQIGVPWGNSTRLLTSITTMVNLSESRESIFKKFSKSTKAKCKQAAKLGLVSKTLYLQDEAPEWENFVSNHTATFKRSGGLPYSKPTMDMLRNLIKMGFAQLINFYERDVCAASLILCTYKKSAIYFASGVKPHYYDFGVSAYIHWNAMQQLSANGYQWYEMGQSYPGMRNSKLFHIGQFKKSFGGVKSPTLAATFVTSRLAYISRLIIPRIAKNLILTIRR